MAHMEWIERAKRELQQQDKERIPDDVKNRDIGRAAVYGLFAVAESVSEVAEAFQE